MSTMTNYCKEKKWAFEHSFLLNIRAVFMTVLESNRYRSSDTVATL